MLQEDAFNLLEKNILKKGCKIKMDIKGFEETFTEIDDAYVNKARPFELEDDGIVIVINGEIYDSAWIKEIEVN